ncbi:MAG: inositol monophosphatase family protein [Halobacteriota archaeon]
MQIKDLLEISSGIRDAIKSYMAGTANYGEIIAKRERDVTRRVDMFAEKALEQALDSRNLCARVISEELGDHVYPKGEDPEFTLIFDPLDGSTNAILGIPFFCTSIAYSPKIDHIRFGDIQAGAVATISGKTFYAVKGGSAFVDGKKLPREVKGKTKLVLSIYSYGAGSIPEGLIQFQKETKNVVVRVLGSIAMEICMVAEGAIDAVIDVRGLINGYDIAGASLILKEAGGIITDLKGNELVNEAGKAQNISLTATLVPEIYNKIRGIVV